MLDLKQVYKLIYIKRNNIENCLWTWYGYYKYLVILFELINILENG